MGDPIGELEEFFFCGSTAVEGRPYCQTHMARATAGRISRLLDEERDEVRAKLELARRARKQVA